MSEPRDDFPVPAPEGATPTKGKKHHVITPEQRAKMNEGRKRKESEKASLGAAAAKTKTDVELRTQALHSLKRWRAEAGAAGLMVVPIPATYIAKTDDEILESMVRLAGKNAKILAGLAAGGDVLAAIVVLRWAAGLGVATAVQFGRLDVDSKPSQTFGVDEIADELEREGYIGIAEREVDEVVEPVEVRSGDDRREPRPAPAGVAVVS